MIKTKYTPKTQKQKLGYLIEECGEVLTAVGKSMRWGIESVNPESRVVKPETNREWILRELDDLDRAVFMVRASLRTGTK